MLTIAIGVIAPMNMLSYWKTQDEMETKYSSYNPLHSVGWAIAANKLLSCEAENYSAFIVIKEHLQMDWKETKTAFEWAEVLHLHDVLLFNSTNFAIDKYFAIKYFRLGQSLILEETRQNI